MSSKPDNSNINGRNARRHRKPNNRVSNPQNSRKQSERLHSTHAPAVGQQISAVTNAVGNGTTFADNSHFSMMRFANAPISKESKMGIIHEFLSDVQAATLTPALSGKDLLVQAKTGTGKTLAFLLPAVERILSSSGRTQQGVKILVVAPTRELALQIEKEAQILLVHHHLRAQHVIGGTNINSEVNNLTNGRCDILIATPGRLLDHLTTRAESRLQEKLRSLQCVVYDEADRLLDQGFRPDIERIQTFLPSKDGRQHFLFSATFSEPIKQVAKLTMRSDYEFISMLSEDEVNAHQHVPQSSVILPFPQHLPAALQILQEDMQINPGASKCLAFFPTARQTQFAAEAFIELAKTKKVILPEIFEIHSRKSQSARVKAADRFKQAKDAWLFSSDVTARGMDFPNVTLVLQVGLPANTEQYIHRLGRTARAGASGRGVVVLSPDEQPFLSKKEMLALAINPMHVGNDALLGSQSLLKDALKKVDKETKASAYRAGLGYYNSNLKLMKWSKPLLVARMNEGLGEVWGWEGEKPPGLEMKTVGKMGLRGVEGLNIEKRTG